MAIYRIKAPDGNTYQISGPDGATDAQVRAAVLKQHPSAGMTAAVRSEHQDRLNRAEAELAAQDTSSPSRASMAGRAGLHAGSLGLRNTIESVLGTVALPFDIPITAMNVGIGGLNRLAGTNVPQQRTFAQDVSTGLDTIGLDRPETENEETLSAIQRAITGAGAGIKAGNALSGIGGRTGDLAAALRQNPGAQVAGSVTGSLSSEAARRSGGGPTSQLFAGAAGGAIPSLAASGLPAITRALARGGESHRQQFNTNAQAFRNLGANPTVGQASTSRLAKGTEAYLSRGLSGSGPLERALSAQNSAIGRAASNAASTISRNVDETKAGLQIERGLRGFVDTAKARQRDLYKDVDRYVSDTERVSMDNTKALLDELHIDIEGAPAQSRLLRDKSAMRLRSAIKSDTEGFESVAANPEYAHLFEGKNVSDATKALFAEFSADGKTPYEALRKVRSFVGAAMAEPSLTKATRDNFSKIYGALTQDIESVIWSKGPEATNAFNRANDFTRGFMRRMELVDTAIDKNGGPERVFKAAVSGTDDGATVINAVMKSLPQEGKNAVSAMVLEKLGRGEGRTFNIDTFRSNWDGMSPRAKRTLFSNMNDETKAFVDNITRVVDIKRQGAQVFGGDKVGGSSWVQQGQVGAGLLAGLSAVGGNPVPLLGFGGLMAGERALAKKMSDPNTVRWLGQRSSPINYGYNAQLNNLAQQMMLQEDNGIFAK